VVRAALGLIVRELDDLEVAREGADGLVAADLPAIARMDQVLLQAFAGAERDLPQRDLVRRDVGDQASPQEEEGREDQ
jgi:hypothetical protein